MGCRMCVSPKDCSAGGTTPCLLTPSFWCGPQLRQDHCTADPQGAYLFYKKCWEQAVNFANFSFRTLMMSKPTIIFIGGCNSVGEGVALFNFSTWLSWNAEDHVSKMIPGFCTYMLSSHCTSQHPNSVIVHSQKGFVFPCGAQVAGGRAAPLWSWFDLWQLCCAHILLAELSCMEEQAEGTSGTLGLSPCVISSGITLENKFNTGKGLHVGKAKEGVIHRVIPLQEPCERQRVFLGTLPMLESNQNNGDWSSKQIRQIFPQGDYTRACILDCCFLFSCLFYILVIKKYLKDWAKLHTAVSWRALAVRHGWEIHRLLYRW